jgi:glycosyltransferase involved in cell wall biosynthesis
MTSTASGPKVSVGLPVYNGSRYLAQAIDSVLDQTYGNLELIISDNASTDATPEICREYAARDGRVLYHRQDRNIGAGPNHNCVARLASGKYFRWASDDDAMEPEYLARCVAMLESHPDAVLCHTRTRIIGDKGEGFAAHLEGLDANRPSDRFAVVILRPHWCVEVLGLIRCSELGKTNLQAPYFGGDKTLMAELALLGRLLHVPEPLFINRDHPGRSMRAVPFHRRQEFHDPSHARQRVTHWALYTDYWRAVERHVKDPREKIRCYGHLARWWVANHHAVRLSLDVVYATAPRVAAQMYRLRETYHRRGIGAQEGR